MKKILGIILFISFFIVIDVNAECSLEEQNNLNAAANNVNVSWSVTDPSENTDPRDVNYHIKLSFYNLQEDLYVKINNDYNKQVLTYDYSDTTNGAFNLYGASDMYKVTYTISVLSNKASCMGTMLRKITLTTPRYNEFSASELCKDIPEYELCGRFYEYDLTWEEFKADVEEYKKVKEEKENPTVKGTISRVFNYYIEHYYWTIPLTCLLIVGIIALILYRKKRII